MEFRERTDFAEDCPVSGDCLYFQPDYLRIQQHKHLRIFEIRSRDRTICTFPINLMGKTATSIPGAPFGSAVLSTKISESLLEDFLTFCLRSLAASGIDHLQVVTPPAIYDSFISGSCLEKVGFQQQAVDLNQHLWLNRPLALHKMQQRKLSKASNLGVRNRLMTSDELPAAHDFIAQARIQKGIKVNISLETLSSLVSTFPNRYKIFGSFLEDQLIAACIVALTSDQIAYYFLPAMDRNYSQVSPLVTLMLFIADQLRFAGFEILDLGVSSINGKKQKGLYEFKARMGALETPKITYSLAIHP